MAVCLRGGPHAECSGLWAPLWAHWEGCGERPLAASELRVLSLTHCPPAALDVSPQGHKRSGAKPGATEPAFPVGWKPPCAPLAAGGQPRQGGLPFGPLATRHPRWPLSPRFASAGPVDEFYM